MTNTSRRHGYDGVSIHLLANGLAELATAMLVFVCQCITQFLWAILAAAMRVCLSMYNTMVLANTSRSYVSVCLSMY